MFRGKILASTQLLHCTYVAGNKEKNDEKATRALQTLVEALCSRILESRQSGESMEDFVRGVEHHSIYKSVRVACLFTCLCDKSSRGMGKLVIPWYLYGTRSKTVTRYKKIKLVGNIFPSSWYNYYRTLLQYDR